MPELFKVELKFTIDCSKKWFDRKHKILELNDAVKFEFKQSNPIANEITCCLCDFPLESRAKNGWADHVFKAEHLFLSNIYSRKEMKNMGIDNFEHFSKKLNKVLDRTDLFCKKLKNEADDYPTDSEEVFQEIKKIKTTKEDENCIFI